MRSMTSLALRSAAVCATLVAVAACAADEQREERSDDERDEAASTARDAASTGTVARDAAATAAVHDASARAPASGGGKVDAATTPRADAGASPGDERADASATTGTCAPPRRQCGDSCVDVRSSRQHCGECGATCGASERCEAGSCRAAESCADSCPHRSGVDWSCKLRFMYGLNYAWHHFGADFGGNAAWSQPGVSGNPKVESELAQLSSSGVSVLRWWMFPDFRGDGVTFDAADTPTGLGGTFSADLDRALQLAEDYDLYLMLTPFSFDNFRPTKSDNGRRARGIRAIILDPQKRAALLERVVRPLARAAAASPHARRVIAWDVINEPEWAIKGESLYGGDPDFDPNPELESISHGEMEAFLRDVIAVLRAESEALISVGATAIKWRHAWSKLDVDFHQFHTYDWVNMYWPYDRSPAEYGISDKPVVMGEFPARGLSNVSYATMVDSWFSGGYAGALAWSYSDAMFGGPAVLPEVKRFAERHACETRY
jgi:hypothetical protein